MFDTLRFWLARGVDGFRIDVLSLLVEDDQLRDNPPNPALPAGRGLPLHARAVGLERRPARDPRAGRPDPPGGRRVRRRPGAAGRAGPAAGADRGLLRRQRRRDPGPVQLRAAHHRLGGQGHRRLRRPLPGRPPGRRLAELGARQPRRAPGGQPGRPGPGPGGGHAAADPAGHAHPLPGRRARPRRRAGPARAGHGPDRPPDSRPRPRPRAHPDALGRRPRRRVHHRPRPGCRSATPTRPCTWPPSATTPPPCSPSTAACSASAAPPRPCTPAPTTRSRPTATSSPTSAPPPTAPATWSPSTSAPDPARLAVPGPALAGRVACSTHPDRDGDPVAAPLDLRGDEGVVVELG